jgi:hypothetical protein
MEVRKTVTLAVKQQETQNADLVAAAETPP